MTPRRALVRILDRPGGRTILGTAIGLLARKHAQGAQVYFRDGMWMHRTGDIVFVDSPTVEYHPSIFRVWANEAENRCEYARDHWFHAYQSRPGDIVVDVGAGKGEDALGFSRAVGPSGRVICVEAHPETFKCLRLFAEVNHLQNVKPIHCAIVNKRGPVSISQSGEWQANSIGDVSGSNSLTAPGITLDQLVAQENISRIDFLKMNIEGAESAAMLGMRDSLRITRAVCISCHDFRAERGDGESFRTKTTVAEAVRDAGFAILSRDSDPRCFIRDQVNAIRIEPTAVPRAFADPRS